MPHFHALVEHTFHIIPYLRKGLSQPVWHAQAFLVHVARITLRTLPKLAYFSCNLGTAAVTCAYRSNGRDVGRIWICWRYERLAFWSHAVKIDALYFADTWTGRCDVLP